MKKLFLIISFIGIMVSFSLTGCKKEETAATEDIIPVKVVELKKENVRSVIASSGQFSTDDETFLSFKTGGIIKTIFVKEGDAVKRGQLLAALELTEISAGVSQANEGYEKALRDYKRVNNLYKDSVTTLAQLQDAKTGLEISTHQLEIANYNLRHSEIKAICDGFILKKFVTVGTFVSPGMPILQTNGASKGNWILKVGVSDNEWSAIKINDSAIIEIDAAPDKKFEAKVFRKSEGVDLYTGTFTIELRLTKKPTVQLASGLFGRAVITPTQTLSSWLVPYDAILDGERNSAFVFTTEDYKTVRKMKVNIVEVRENNVLISEGLENSKALITSGSAYLNHGSSIRVVR